MNIWMDSKMKANYKKVEKINFPYVCAHSFIVCHLRNKINYPKIINYSSFEFCFIHQLDEKLVSKV